MTRTIHYRRARTYAGRLMLLALCCVVAGCTLVAPEEERARAQLERAWRRWNAGQIHSYTFVQRKLCYCAEQVTLPVKVYVDADVVTDIRFLRDNSPVPTTFNDIWGTVDDLFHLIERALDDNAHSLLVTYHESLGYPTHIAIDYQAPMVDDEISITATELVAR